MRCKACDVVLDAHESAWDEELKEHDNMCYTCRAIVAEAEYVDAMEIYNEDTFNDLIFDNSKESADG